MHHGDRSFFMKAMILAAGLGTRLRPLTNDRPKALVELNGRTLLEIVISRLASFGVTDFIVNVHHLADQVVSYLKSKNNFGFRMEISREDDLLLDTGGGLKKAAWFFEDGSAALDEPFFLHNVDVVSNIDLSAMLQSHKKHNALATLAVQARESSRQLLFDGQLQLRARLVKENGSTNPNLPGTHALAFTGIHVLSPRILPLLTESGPFSIIDSYLRLSSEGRKVLAFRADSFYWRDLGRPADLVQASLDLQRAGSSS